MATAANKPRFILYEDWNTGRMFLYHHDKGGWSCGQDRGMARIFRTRQAAQKIADKINPPVPYTYHENHFCVEELDGERSE